ncbi:unnamed protein product [marine sediment metagenome]|uniref:Uncharacterized protein n=1 Tax=marine sediment metagenome TaxID=412755 RepID=X0X6C2_9ZZZZ
MTATVSPPTKAAILGKKYKLPWGFILIPKSLAFNSIDLLSTGT